MNYYLLFIFLLFLYMNFWFIVSLIIKRNDIADIAWGLGFVFLAWCAILTYQSFSWISILVNCLVTIWGLRLSIHIFLRNRKKGEDYRYQQWRIQWGKWFTIRSYLQIFMLQGGLLYLIVFPVLFINLNSYGKLNLFDFIGLFVWLIGFFFETVGDWQLSRFIKNSKNKGKIIQTGLWKYSRHPNYFGEVTLWWGIYIFALSIPYGFITVFSPITITTLILFISGIPLLERKYLGRADFEDYKKQTSIFIPLPPRSV